MFLSGIMARDRRPPPRGKAQGPADPLEDIDIGSARTGPSDALDGVEFGMKKDEKKCPYCDEVIKMAAKKCRWCMEWLTTSGRKE
tara:strand:+ start:29 stop:283 length:255 start_codon:yes stop_codon:yes gene_type:complete